ncbi:MAG: potassium channel family protein [Candidatus Micrarchaeia archaeon]
MAEESVEEIKFGWFLLFLLLLLSLIPILVTFNVVYGIFHNVYEALYTIAYVFFNANGVDPFASISGFLPLFSSNFDLLTTLVVVDGFVRIVVIGFLISIFVQLITRIDIRSRFSLLKARRLKHHVIIAGYYDVVEDVCKSLKDKGMDFIVIEEDEKKLEVIQSLGYQFIKGDFTKDSVLKGAMIEKAKAIVFSSKDDYKNLFGVVTAHYLNSKVKIISKASQESSVTKMHRAGAALCVVPEILAGIEAGDYLSKAGAVPVRRIGV